MTDIKIKVSGKVALCRKRYLVSSNADYTVTFEFDSDWDAHTVKTARFIFDEKYTDVSFMGNTVAVPKVIACKTLGIGVYSDSVASTVADIGCVISAKDFDGEAAGELTDEQYTSLLELINSLDLRQIQSVSRIDGNIQIVFTDNTTTVLPVYDGVSVTGCSLSESGELSFTLSDGSTITAGNVKGEKGEKGETGATPNLTIGTVTTLEADRDAEATITGTAAEPVLNLSIPQGKSGGAYFKKIYSGTLTEATKSFKLTTFADGTPLRFTELFIRGAATTNLAAGNVQNLNVYYGWEGDGNYNAYKGIGFIPYFCQPSGTDISSSEYSMKAELLGTKIYNQYGYGTAKGVSKTEVKPSDTDIFTQLAFWSGGNGVWQPGSWFEVYARCENGELGLNPDTTPTAGSTNLVTSGGVYEAINTAINEAVGAALGGSY